MVRPVIIALGAIPAIVALLLVFPLITKTEIPFSAAGPADTIEFEYTKHHLQKVSFGITERAAATKTEILVIQDDGKTRYLVTKDGVAQPEIRSEIAAQDLARLKALIKETGFITIRPESFPISDGITEYVKSNVKITLNGETNQVYWPEQNATEMFVPPIITMVEAHLDQVIKDIRE